MEQKEFLDYIEDNPIEIREDWFFHGTSGDINVIEKILNEGIKCAYLRKEKSTQGFNGKYYVSVSKKSDDTKSIYNVYKFWPTFIIDGVKPIKADIRNQSYQCFRETIIPLRTSYKKNEYHAFLKIDSSKIIALGYSLYHMLEPGNKFYMSRLYQLKELVLLLEQLEKDIPIYDLSSEREINKEKVKVLKIEECLDRNKKMY